jgi:hypothetical protein
MNSKKKKEIKTSRKKGYKETNEKDWMGQKRRKHRYKNTAYENPWEPAR